MEARKLDNGSEFLKGVTSHCTKVIPSSEAASTQLSSSSSNFTPINPHGPLSFVQSHIPSSEMSSGTDHLDLNDTPQQIGALKGLSGMQHHQSELKRKGSARSSRCNVKRRKPDPLLTASSSPFSTLKVTKFDSHALNDAKQSANLGDYVKLMTMTKILPKTEHLPQSTAMDRLTPRLTHDVHSSTSDHGRSQGPLSYGDRPHQVQGEPGYENFSDGSRQADVEDYEIDEYMEEEMLRLMDKPHAEDRIPPSSILEQFDHDSRSADEYDRDLQHSSLHTSPESDNASLTTSGEHGGPPVLEDLLDEDVDWDAVYDITKNLPKDASFVAFHEGHLPQVSLGQPSGPDQSVSDFANRADDFLATLKRPPFPEKIRDRSLVSGASSKTVLRTCFHVEELVNQATHCVQHHQDALFELYARVTYSSRERMARKQHFQFGDLLKDEQPYPSGVLTGWRLGSHLDRQSQAFINTLSPKLCCCMCSLKRDPRALIGWAIEVLKIKEIGWEDVRYARAILTGPNECAEDEA